MRFGSSFGYSHLYKQFFIVVLLSIACLSCGGGGSSSQTPTPSPPAPTPTPNPTPTPSPTEPTVEVANPNIPSDGKLIISATPTNDFNTIEGSNNNSVVGRASTVDIVHPNADKGIQIEVLNPTGQFWSGQVQLPITEALNKDDVLLLYVEFKMVESNDETGAGYITAFIESPAPEYTKYLQFSLSSTGEWQEYFLPLTISEDFNANEIAVKFGFGAGDKTQTVQLANIQLFNYETQLSIDQLPVTRPTYQGREPDAAWRAEAQARIEAHRKGNLTLTIQDAQGQALENATVRVKQLKHEYHFGSVATTRHLVGSDSDSQTYREKLQENFNQSGIENGLKWPAWAGEWGDNFSQEKTISALQWLQNNGFYSRGHVMIWPSKRNMPNYVQQYMPEGAPNNADAAVLEEVRLHIQDISGKTQNIVDEWDVLNEPFDNHYLMDAFGNNIMVEWFEQARTDNPNADLYINDYSIISGGGTNTAHQDHFFNTIGFLLENNAPIDGIGVQSHFSATPTPITTIYTILDRFATAYPNLNIRATELDIDTFDEDMQADFTRDFLTIFFSHPATVGIQKWGFWEGAHWRPNAAMYTLDWQAKPNQVAWQALIYNTWWSEFELISNSEGKVSEKAFYGEYSVEVLMNSELMHTDTIVLSKGDDLNFIIRM